MIINPINVVSLFDGMSCGQIALGYASIPVNYYYAAEIDKYASKVAKINYPNMIQLGDVTNWRRWCIDWSKVDLILAGSPCQGFSFAGKQLAFDDPRSALFFVFVDILNHVRKVNPNVKFLLENVKMKKEFLDVITGLVGVEPMLINSALVSAQNRERYYWFNWEATQPADEGIVLADIIENESDINEKPVKDTIRNRKHYRNLNQKSLCMTATMYKGAGNNGMSLIPYNFFKGARQVGRRLNENGKRDDYNKDIPIQQRFETRADDKANCITTVSKDSMLAQLAAINPRVKGITVDAEGIRPHQGDERKSGISEIGKILNKDAKKTYTLTMSHAPKVMKSNCVRIGTADDINGHDLIKRVYSPEGKSPTLNACTGGNREPKIATDNVFYRKLTPLECERLQTNPDNYTNHVSNSQRYKMLGNGWTSKVPAHILSFLHKS